MASVIQEQVKLPLSVACDVVLQGIRIRLGRSVVTMTGVLLGIAFLMSILAGQVIKSGVRAEEDLRLNVRRMGNFLAAEVGPPKDRRYGVLVLGPLSPSEARLLAQLRQGGAAALSAAPVVAGVALPAETIGPARFVELAQVATDAHAVLLLGDGPLPALDWSALLAPAQHRVVAVGPAALTVAPGEGVTVVRLQRELRAEEQQAQVQEAARERFRRYWIICISLLVTVICISNSMLMSVTERFREIGTMKCLGALSSFVRQLFLIESSLMGLAGSVLGSLGGFLFALIAYGFTYGFGLVFGALALGPLLLDFALCLVAGIVLSVVAALYPAQIASQMVPANALRTNV